METTRFHDLQLSRMMLGTVQFGLEYGIANTLGRPDLSSVRAILTAAHECGINCLDTAAIYGDSEIVIGQVLEELGLSDQFTVVTKLPHLADDFSSEQAVDDFIESAIMNSLQRLRLEVLPICLFHNYNNYRYWDSLRKMRDRGLVRYIGCSLNDILAVPKILEHGQAQAIQFPTNVLDSHYIREGILRAAPQTALFARSIYLQGLLLMTEDQVPDELKPVIPVRHAMQAVAREAGMPAEELYMRYVLSIEGISSLVIGVETAAQLRHNAALVARGPLDCETFEATQRAVPELPESLVTPGLWSNRMPPVTPLRA